MIHLIQSIFDMRMMHSTNTILQRDIVGMAPASYIIETGVNFERTSQGDGLAHNNSCTQFIAILSVCKQVCTFAFCLADMLKCKGYK